MCSQNWAQHSKCKEHRCGNEQRTVGDRNRDRLTEEDRQTDILRQAADSEEKSEEDRQKERSFCYYGPLQDVHGCTYSKQQTDSCWAEERKQTKEEKEEQQKLSVHKCRDETAGSSYVFALTLNRGLTNFVRFLNFCPSPHHKTETACQVFKRPKSVPLQRLW